MDVRVRELIGIVGPQAAGALLLERRSEDLTAGLWEAGDIDWWWAAGEGDEFRTSHTHLQQRRRRAGEDVVPLRPGRDGRHVSGDRRPGGGGHPGAAAERRGRGQAPGSGGEVPLHGRATGGTDLIQPTGRPIAVREIIICRVAGGKIQETSGTFDRLAVLEQLGAVPSARNEDSSL